MKTIQKDELFVHVKDFLKTKGIELSEGSYSKGIHAGCSLLADAINLSQTGIERAKTGLDKKLSQVRQAIHERTAPRPTKSSAQSTPPRPPTNPKAKSNTKTKTNSAATRAKGKSRTKRRG